MSQLLKVVCKFLPGSLLTGQDLFLRFQQMVLMILEVLKEKETHEVTKSKLVGSPHLQRVLCGLFYLMLTRGEVVHSLELFDGGS